MTPPAALVPGNAPSRGNNSPMKFVRSSSSSALDIVIRMVSTPSVLMPVSTAITF